MFHFLGLPVGLVLWVICRTTKKISVFAQNRKDRVCDFTAGGTYAGSGTELSLVLITWLQAIRVIISCNFSLINDTLKWKIGTHTAGFHPLKI